MKSKKTLVLFLILCFLTILIVVSSVLFSVKTVVGYCYNADDATLNEQVVEASQVKLKKGSNIFLVREKEVIAEVESKLPNVWVINVERVFPSGVYINYVKIKEYFVVQNKDKYLYVSNNGKILRTSALPESEKRIKLLFDGNPLSTESGDMLFDADSNACSILTGFMSALHRMEGKSDNIVAMFDFVDMSMIDKNELFVKTAAGVCIEIQYPGMHLFEKVRFAVSVLNQTDFDHKSKGTITVYDAKDGVHATWTEKDKYAEIKSQN